MNLIRCISRLFSMHHASATVKAILTMPTGVFQVNTTCGDQATLQVRLSADGSRVEKIAWDGQGCSISQASLSIMHDLAEGKTVADIDELYTAFRDMMDQRGQELDEDMADLLDDAAAFQGVSKFPMRIKCALLGWMALRDATDKALDQKHT